MPIRTSRTSITQALAPFVLASAWLPAAAQTLPPTAHVVNLTSSAQVEVTKDVLAITFTATREGADAQSVQTALKQALDAALAEARRVLKAGQIDVCTGNFSIYPRHALKGGGITGWQGTAELVVEGRDMSGIA